MVYSLPLAMTIVSITEESFKTVHTCQTANLTYTNQLLKICMKIHICLHLVAEKSFT